MTEQRLCEEPQLKRDGWSTGNKMTVSTGTIIHIYSAVKAVKAPYVVAPPVVSFLLYIYLLFLLYPGSNPPDQR